jgi:hypothetical protein
MHAPRRMEGLHFQRFCAIILVESGIVNPGDLGPSEKVLSSR